MNVSPSSETPCTAIAISVISDSDSCTMRRSRPRFLNSRVTITRPSPTDRLEAISAKFAAARLVIQKRWGPGSEIECTMAASFDKYA